MGYNARNDEIRDNVTRMRRDWAANANRSQPFAASMPACRERLFVVLAEDRRRARLKASLADHRVRPCDTVVDLDLRVKPRDPEASIRVALRGVQCPRCNGHGRPRIIALSQWPSV